MRFIKQCKGKDLTNIPVSKLGNEFYVSTKYDGNYVQIHKVGNEVKFYTSSGKEFYLIDVADELIRNNVDIDFAIECEYIASTNGKLGSRGKCTTTTFRTLFNKSLPSYANDAILMCFDIIYLKYTEEDDFANLGRFSKRLRYRDSLRLGPNIKLVKHEGPFSLDKCKEMAKELTNLGWEGIMCYSPDHIYSEGKRQNTSVKIKGRPTADLKCIGIEEGEGKYTGLIGSLILQDDKGRIVKVGSGLDDIDRYTHHNYFIGSMIEIEYEQILDTYIQPTFKCVRKDK